MYIYHKDGCPRRGCYTETSEENLDTAFKQTKPVVTISRRLNQDGHTSPSLWAGYILCEHTYSRLFKVVSLSLSNTAAVVEQVLEGKFTNCCKREIWE